MKCKQFMWGVLPPSLTVFLFVQVLCRRLDCLGASPFLPRSDCRLQSNRTFEILPRTTSWLLPICWNSQPTLQAGCRVLRAIFSCNPIPKKYFPATQHTAQLKNRLLLLRFPASASRKNRSTWVFEKLCAGGSHVLHHIMLVDQKVCLSTSLVMTHSWIAKYQASLSSIIAMTYWDSHFDQIWPLTLPAQSFELKSRWYCQTQFWDMRRGGGALKLDPWAFWMAFWISPLWLLASKNHFVNCDTITYRDEVLGVQQALRASVFCGPMTFGPAKSNSFLWCLSRQNNFTSVAW